MKNFRILLVALSLIAINLQVTLFAQEAEAEKDTIEVEGRYYFLKKEIKPTMILIITKRCNVIPKQ